MKKTTKLAILAASAVVLSACSVSQPTAEHNAMAMHQTLKTSMHTMAHDMHAGMAFNNPDYAFAAGMLPHHIGAVDMAKVELQYGKNPQMRQLATNIIVAQDKEIKEMQHWLATHKADATQSPSKQSVAMHAELKSAMAQMNKQMMKGMSYDNADYAFAAGMLPHHIGAVAMAKVELQYGKNLQMRQLAKNIVRSQDQEIKEMQAWLKANSTLAK